MTTRRARPAGWLALGVMLLVAPYAPPARAQQGESTSDRLGLHVMGGVAIPATPAAFPDGWGLGFGGATGLDYNWKPGLELTADVNFYTFDFDLAGQSFSGSNFNGASLWTLSLLGGLRAQSKKANAVVPFVHGQAGLAMASITSSSLSGAVNADASSETTVAFTLELMAGAHFMPVGSGIAYCFDAGWQPVFVSGEMLSYFPIRFGIEF